MKLLDDIYVYPWTSYEANNCNALFIDGVMPTIVDPGHLNFIGHVANGMSADGKDIRSVQLVLCTHSHPDHIEAADSFDSGAMRTIGKTEFDHMSGGGKELFMMTGCEMPRKPFSFFLNEGILNIGDKRFQVFLTPGHSPGSICLYWEEKKLLISGDTLFYLGVGRTDLPGGNMQSLAQSIKRLSTLDIEYLVPGHGDIVKGSETIKKNFKAITNEFF